MDTPETRGTDDTAPHTAPQPPDPDAPVNERSVAVDERSDPSDNSPDKGDEPRGLFETFADDLDAGRITPDDAVRRLARGLAAQERGESDDEVRAAFYPDESDEAQ